MKTSLDKRITLVTFMVAMLVMALFAVIIAYASSRIEHSVLDQMLIKEFGDIHHNLDSGETQPLHNTAQLRSWLTADPEDKNIPRAFRKLPPGLHHEVESRDSSYHVLREPMEDRFLTLAYDIDLIEAKENQFKIVLIGMVLIAPALVMLLSFLFTRSATRPVMKLARKLQALDPARRNVRLGEDFSGEEVEAIARAFDRYQERLDLLVEREQSFSSAASHELRTPLASINASAELLAGMAELPPAARRHVGRIGSAVGMMSDVVNSLLALSRDTRPQQVAPLHVLPVLEEAVANYRDQLADKAVALEYQCDDEVVLWVPVGEFLIILGNLLQNAIRNTEQGRINVSCSREQLVVSDTGRGMPREFAPHIFDRHVQAHDSHGVGLGLHIVKRLCDRAGWRIQVESSLGQGTTVTVVWTASA